MHWCGQLAVYSTPQLAHVLCCAGGRFTFLDEVIKTANAGGGLTFPVQGQAPLLQVGRLAFYSFLNCAYLSCCLHGLPGGETKGESVGARGARGEAPASESLLSCTCLPSQTCVPAVTGTIAPSAGGLAVVRGHR